MSLRRIDKSDSLERKRGVIESWVGDQKGWYRSGNRATVLPDELVCVDYL